MVFTGKKIARICTSSSFWFLQRCVGAWRLGPAPPSSTASSIISQYLSCSSTGSNRSRRLAGTAAAALQTQKSWLGLGEGRSAIAAAAPSPSSGLTMPMTPLSMGPIYYGSARSVGDKTERIRSLLRQHHEHPADGLQVWCISLDFVVS